MTAARILGRTVYVRDADGAAHCLLAGTAPPEWALPQLAGDHLWTDPDTWAAANPPPDEPCLFCGGPPSPLRPRVTVVRPGNPGEVANVCDGCAAERSPVFAELLGGMRQAYTDADAARLLRDALGRR